MPLLIDPVHLSKYHRILIVVVLLFPFKTKNLSTGEPLENDFVESSVNSSFAVCPVGYQWDAELKSCQDIDECRIQIRKSFNSEVTDVCGNLKFQRGYDCFNTEGSFRCVRIADCGFGYTRDPATGDCLDKNECEQLSYELACGTTLKTMRCINTEGSFYCDYKKCPRNQFLNRATGECNPCPAGYRQNLRGTCSDIDECREQLHNCQPYMKCVNYEGTYECKAKIYCELGFRANYNGTDCVDIDECLENSFLCGRTHHCLNQNGSYACKRKVCSINEKLNLVSGECLCKEGFLKNSINNKCYDINECTTGKHRCQKDELCKNTKGHYECLPQATACNKGFVISEDRLSCVDKNECELKLHSCGDHQYCFNTYGSYICGCNEGFRKNFDNGLCEDINECDQSGRCPPGLTCVNKIGNFSCECQNGFINLNNNRSVITNYPLNCVDRNECSDSPNICGRGTCFNSHGSFYCICDNGYVPTEKTGGKCIDVNECEVNPCPSNSKCVNTDGSFTCQCPSGFYFNSTKRKCVDVNECLNVNQRCSSAARCFNYVGSYTCYNSSCPANFQFEKRNIFDGKEISHSCKHATQSCDKNVFAGFCISKIDYILKILHLPTTKSVRLRKFLVLSKNEPSKVAVNFDVRATLYNKQMDVLSGDVSAFLVIRKTKIMDHLQCKVYFIFDKFKQAHKLELTLTIVKEGRDRFTTRYVSHIHKFMYVLVRI